MERLRASLKQPHVHLADEHQFLTKADVFVSDGPSKLLVLADFDMTLTKYYVNGERGYTSHGVIENSQLMPELYRQKALELQKKYAPIETSKDFPQDQRIKAMEEWWAQAHDLLVELNMTRDTIREMVSQANIALRPGCDEVFAQLESWDVPLIIFSAGLADTITETLSQRSSIRKNMRVISNRMLFDSSGVSYGFSHPVIHSYNKGHSAEQFSTVFDEVKCRTNVLLIGDSMGDPKMVNGLQNVENVIRIGFLNSKVDELLPTYLKMYDVVLTQDSSMEVVHELLCTVLKI